MIQIDIDIDADLNLVDDDDRSMARLPAGPAALVVGGVAVAGRPGFWSWVIVDEINDMTVWFKQVSSREVAKHGDLGVAASVFTVDEG